MDAAQEQDAEDLPPGDCARPGEGREAQRRGLSRIPLHLPARQVRGGSTRVRAYKSSYMYFTVGTSFMIVTYKKEEKMCNFKKL